MFLYGTKIKVEPEHDNTHSPLLVADTNQQQQPALQLEVESIDLTQQGLDKETESFYQHEIKQEPKEEEHPKEQGQEQRDYLDLIALDPMQYLAAEEAERGTRERPEPEPVQFTTAMSLPFRPKDVANLPGLGMLPEKGGSNALVTMPTTSQPSVSVTHSVAAFTRAKAPVLRALGDRNDLMEQPRTECWERFLHRPKRHALICEHEVETEDMVACSQNCKTLSIKDAKAPGWNVECDDEICARRARNRRDSQHVIVSRRNPSLKRQPAPRVAQQNRLGTTHQTPNLTNAGLAHGPALKDFADNYGSGPQIKPPWLQREERKLVINGTEKLGKLEQKIQRAPIPGFSRIEPYGARFEQQMLHSDALRTRSSRNAIREQHAGQFSGMPEDVYREILLEEGDIINAEEYHDNLVRYRPRDEVDRGDRNSDDGEVVDSTEGVQPDGTFIKKESYCVCESEADSGLVGCFKCGDMYHPACLKKKAPCISDDAGIPRCECYGCGRAIAGARHQCLDCPGVDLCHVCFKEVDNIHADHRFEHVQSLDFTCLKCDKQTAGTMDKPVQSKKSIFNEIRRGQSVKRKRQEVQKELITQREPEPDPDAMDIDVPERPKRHLRSRGKPGSILDPAEAEKEAPESDSKQMKRRKVQKRVAFNSPGNNYPFYKMDNQTSRY